MEGVLIAAGLGLFVGFRLGVLVMALLAATDRNRLPESAPVRVPAGRAAWPDLRESRAVATGPARAGALTRSDARPTSAEGIPVARDHRWAEALRAPTRWCPASCVCGVPPEQTREDD